MSLRERMMQDDMYAVVEACVEEKDCPFYGFKFQDDCFHFEYKGLFTRNSYRINMGADYPEGTIKAVQSNKYGDHFETELVNERVPNIFNEISKKIYRNMNVQLPHVEPDSEDEDNTVSPPEVEEMIAQAPPPNGDEEEFSSEDSDCEYEEYDGIYDDEEEGSSKYKDHPLLLEDIESMERKFGKQAIHLRHFPDFGEIDIDLNIPTDHFDPVIAKSWNILKTEPIVMRINMSLHGYLDSPDLPKLTCLQKAESFGIGSQLSNAVQLMLTEQWAAHSVDFVQAARKSASNNSGASQDDKYAGRDLIKKIRDMGFTGGDMNDGIIRNALIFCKGCVADAVTMLIDQPTKCVGAAAAAQAERLPDIDLSKKKKSVRSSDLPALKPEANAKLLPPLADGFLCMLYDYCRQRLETLNEFCVVCDEPHVFQGANTMLKPAVCGRDLCVYAFNHLGVMSDAAEDVATGPEVVDLLIAMAKTACASDRKDVIFDPYPTIVDPHNDKQLAISPNMEKDYARCLKALEALNMGMMMRNEGVNLKKELDKRDILAFPMLQWVITSNRSYIVQLPLAKQLIFMNTQYQYLLVNSPPAKEAKFQEAKTKYGSTFAFHGSNIANWHSIMRQGLLNASGTRHQINGAAYGKGVYLSPTANLSSAYSSGSRGAKLHVGNLAQGTSKTKSKSVRAFLTDKTNLICMALCEVVTSPELNKANNDIWVMPNTDHVCTRFFFVYEQGDAMPMNVRTDEAKYSTQILDAVKIQFH